MKQNKTNEEKKNKRKKVEKLGFAVALKKFQKMTSLLLVKPRHRRS